MPRRSAAEISIDCFSSMRRTKLALGSLLMARSCRFVSPDALHRAGQRLFFLPGVIRLFGKCTFLGAYFEKNTFRVFRGVGRRDTVFLRSIHGFGE